MALLDAQELPPGRPQAFQVVVGAFLATEQMHDDIAEIEQCVFSGYLSMEHDLKQEIAEQVAKAKEVRVLAFAFFDFDLI